MREPPLAPSLFLHEMRSLFVMAARRGRGSRDAMLQQLEVVEKLYGKSAGAGDGLAFKHNLTSYHPLSCARARQKAPLRLPRQMPTYLRKTSIKT